MKRLMITLCAVAAVLILSGPASADWDEGDGHKMHWPQMPDPNGWDICLNHGIIADDFQCSQTGPITDVHFWVSWQGDNARWDLIQSIGLNFYDDIGLKPGNLLHGYNILPTDLEYKWRLAGSGQQGWHCPSTPYTNPVDHLNYYQINLKPLDEPWFHQTMGMHYWLGLSIQMLPDGDPDPSNDPQIGWKTALLQDHYGEFSKWKLGAMPWQNVVPEGLVRDQAFVITGVPEPGTLILVLTAGLGALAYAWRRRRSK